MSDYLVIVESPSKAKTIEKYLGKIQSCRVYGTCSRFAKSQMGIEVKNNFTPKYITIRGKGPVLKDLKSAAKSKESLSRGRIQTVKGKRLLGI